MISLADQSCFSCTHYLRCKDPKKAFNYCCNRYRSTKISEKDSIFRLENLLSKEIEIDYTPKLYDSGYDYDISKTIHKIIKENTLVAPDIRTDDSDFKRAKNFYEFSTSSKFLNQKPFIMQLAIGIRLFSEYCPRCSDVEWLENDIKATDSVPKFTRKVALLEEGVCPYCGSRKSVLYKKGRLPLYDELVGCTGQRSGKSSLVGGLLSPYLLHCYLKLSNPTEVLGLLKSTVLHGTFVALTAKQAKENLWDFFEGSIRESPWFTEYHDMIRDSGNKHGEELLKFKDTFLNYRHRKLLLYFAPPDGRVLRGRTRIWGSIDEIGFFDNMANSKKIKINANEVYIAINNSLRTVRSAVEKLIAKGYDNIPNAYFMNISSPSSSRDKIMSLIRQSVGSLKMLGIHKPTWEMNPTITRKSLNEEFRKNYAEAMRNYGAQPPLTSNPLFSSEESLQRCFTGKRQLLQLIYSRRTSKGGEVKRYASLVKLPTLTTGSVLAIDAGYSNNSFAMMIGTLADGIPSINVLLEIQPSPGIPLHYRAIYDNLLCPLIESCNVQLLLADRWNSLKLLSDVEQDFGIQTRQHSLRYKDFLIFRDYIYDKQIIFPGLAKGKTVKSFTELYSPEGYPDSFRNHPIEHFCMQLMTVQDTGISIIKGDQLTDDLFRASVLGFKYLIDPDLAPMWRTIDAQPNKTIDIKDMAVLRTASGGSLSVLTNTNQLQKTLGKLISRG